MPTVPTKDLHAAGTKVPVERTRSEIERLLLKFHATEFGYHVVDGVYAAIEFKMDGQTYRLYVRYPSRDHKEVVFDGNGYRRTPAMQAKQREQMIRQRWRILRLYIISVLDMVNSEMTTPEEALFANLVLPDDERHTMFEWAEDNLHRLKDGTLPALPAPRERRS